MKQLIYKSTAVATMTAFWVSEALALGRPPSGGGGHGGGGGHAPEIDGPAGLTAIALVACVGLYVYNRYRRR